VLLLWKKPKTATNKTAVYSKFQKRNKKERIFRNITAKYGNAFS